MRGGEFEQKHKWLARVAFWLGAGLLIVAAIRSIHLTDGDPGIPVDRAADGSAERTIRVKRVDLEPTDPKLKAAEQGDFDLTAGEMTSIAVEDLPTERPLILNLLLPGNLTSADSLPARIISMDGRGESKSEDEAELKLPNAVVGTDRDRVRVQIERDWLSPGRYRVEIETAGGAQPTLRRYLLEIR